MEKKLRNKVIKAVLIILCIPLFILGKFLLNDLSTRYQVFLGPTFHVILGCTLMASSSVYFFYMMNKMLFRKRKRSRSSKPHFLKKEREKFHKN
jgi:hypothetical protein